MTCLLDTHILLWTLAEPERLPGDIADRISDPTNTILVSSICITEIAIKDSLGKLDLDDTLRANNYQRLIEAIVESGFDHVPYEEREAALLGTLPFHHRDPFDRMLITQAMARQCPVVTLDSKLARYAIHTIGVNRR